MQERKSEDCSMNKNTPRIAAFVGSFDPFTNGHADIVQRALALFDCVVIGIGVNPDKTYLFSEEERLSAVRSRYADNPRVSVKTYHGLTIDFAKQEKACCLVKGVRTHKDFVYERQQADYNRQQGDIETVILLARPNLKRVSSTRIRAKIQKQHD